MGTDDTRAGTDDSDEFETSDDGWEYKRGSQNLSERSQVELSEPRVVVSKLVPSVEYDAEEKTLSFTTRSE